MTDTQAEIHRPAPATFDSECQTSESESRIFLRKLLNRNVKIKITDGRVLIGTYLCTDKNANIVLGCCKEYPISDSPQASTKSKHTFPYFIVYFLFCSSFTSLL